MPGILWVNSNDPPAIPIDCLEGPRQALAKAPLAVGGGVGVIAGAGRHEADTKHAAVRRITETVHRQPSAFPNFAKLPFHRSLRERVLGIRVRDTQGDLDE